MEVPSLLSFSFNDSTPLQEQLQSHLTDWITSGRLLPGSRLPGSRQMASELGISRNTVSIVLDQLKAEGFLESQPARGVYVSADLPDQGRRIESRRGNIRARPPVLSRYGQALSRQALFEHAKTLPFTPGIPDLSAFPRAVWLSIQKRHQQQVNLMGYHQDQGYLPLRETLADYLCLSRGVHCHAGQIIITQGAQQAISLCAQVLLDAGDAVLIENPGYVGARKAFQASGATLIACPLAEHGIDLQHLTAITTQLKAPARLMYITPTHQYPLGGILPAAQRLALLDWATRSNTWLLEDDYDSEFHYHHKPIACLQGMADNSPVIYMGSFSKTLFPALRLGYLVVPQNLVNVFVQAKSYMSGETPLLSQAVVADFIGEGHFVRHLRRMRKLYQGKWQHLSELLHTHLRHLATPIAQSAGMHLAIEIPGIDDIALKQHFENAGFGSSALTAYFIDEATQLNKPTRLTEATGTAGSAKASGLVLGFANTTEPERERGIRVLLHIIEQIKTLNHT